MIKLTYELTNGKAYTFNCFIKQGDMIVECLYPNGMVTQPRTINEIEELGEFASSTLRNDNFLQGEEQKAFIKIFNKNLEEENDEFIITESELK